MTALHEVALPCLPPVALAALMPMHLWLLPGGQIASAGPTLAKLAQSPLAGALFFDLVDLRRPRGILRPFDLVAAAGGRLVLSFRAAPQTLLRGHAVALASEQGVLVNLSLGIGLGDAVRDHALSQADFAPTDLAVEMLYLAEAKRAVADELAAMAARLSEARKAAEAQALSDAMTGLANRRALEAGLARALAGARGGQPFALLHLDLDFFKAVNDTLGHAAGDHVLSRVATILRESTGASDLAARVGGDEFVMILSGMTEPEALMAHSARLIARLEQPTLFEGQPCRISGSIGIAVSTDYANPDPDRMLSDADRALYASKRLGRGRATVHERGAEYPEERRGAG